MFYFVLGLIIGAGVVWMMKRRGKGLDSGSVAGMTNPNMEEMERKRENLEKVMAMAKKEGEIANDDVEHGLGVSNATATRYLDELAETGKLTRVGTRGKYVIYKVI